MSSASAASPNGVHAATKCTACGGKMETVIRRGAGEIRRCSSCGLEPSDSLQPGRTAAASTGSGAVVGARCKADGCPGVLDASGRCPCCVKRAAWLEQNIPKRHCEICSGVLMRKRALKFCDACKPVAQRVAVHQAHQAKRPKGAAKR